MPANIQHFYNTYTCMKYAAIIEIHTRNHEPEHDPLLLYCYYSVALLPIVVGRVSE